MQASHTQSGVDLCAVARGSGIAHVIDIADDAGLHELSPGCLPRAMALSSRAGRITADDPGRALPEKDGVAIKDRVRRAVELAG